MCFNGSPQILMKVSLRAINLKGDICTASQRFFQESVFAVNILEDQGTSDDALTSITEHLSECENTFLVTFCLNARTHFQLPSVSLKNAHQLILGQTIDQRECV